MTKFTFETYHFDDATKTAHFHYKSPTGIRFNEQVTFERSGEYDTQLLDRALFLSFFLVGTSYYKLFPGVGIELGDHELTEYQADFFNHVYQEGMSQYAFENNLTRQDLGQFKGQSLSSPQPISYNGNGTISLQSGGKDSLLTATLLKNNHTLFTPWYLTNSSFYPSILDTLDEPLSVARRKIDLEGLKTGMLQGGLNGHVPVTYIVASFAMIEAILTGKNTVLLSIGHEGEEPHGWIGDLPVNHQWSKTWPAEQAFSEYVAHYISPDIHIGSPLRQYSELKVSELFIQKAWPQYSHSFSSCNRANYEQGKDNTTLKWCGECPKCANSFLLFAPFVAAEELKELFNNQDLFEKPHLQDTFKGLLGVDDVMKPFECVGETDELRLAYHKSQARGGYGELSFNVPDSHFDYEQIYPHQSWASEMVQ